MSDDLDDLWREFAAETQEHLDTIERLLSERHTAAWSADEIARLFRSFHSLKGAFLAVEFVNLEAVAHRAEDILSLIRDGRAALDAETCAVLLRAVDRLNDMRERALAERADTTPADDILAEFDRYLGAPAPAFDEQAPPLDADQEMLTLYCELLALRLPELATASREEAAESAEQLTIGAEILGFENLAAELRNFVQEARRTDGEASLLDTLEALHDQAATIEEITGHKTGAAELAELLAAHHDGDETGFDALEAAIAEGTDPDVAAAAQILNRRFTVLGWARSLSAILQIEDRFGRGGAEAPASAGWRAAASTAAISLRGASREGRDLTEPEERMLQAGWRSGSRDDPTPARRDGLNAYEILLDIDADADIGNALLNWLSSSVEEVTSRTVPGIGFKFHFFSPQPLAWIREEILTIDPEQRCLRDVRSADGSGAESAPATAVPLPSASPMIRVPSEAVDRLMTEIGEMRIGLSQFNEILRHGRMSRSFERLRELLGRLDPGAAVNFGRELDDISEDLRSLSNVEAGISRIHRGIWRSGLELRVVGIETLFGRVSRNVRDLSRKLGKDVDLVIEGREARIDKSMVDLLTDPLMHMIRNALDHGIESPDRRRAQGKPARAQLRLAAAERADGIHIIVADDGQGLDRGKILAKAIERGLISAEAADALSESEILSFIFRPGFSTASRITDISGRGVGLDVVAETMRRLGGSCAVESEPGAGTQFTLQFPLSAALLTALLVKVDGEILALPERQISAVVEIEAEGIESESGTRRIRHQGAAVPFCELAPLIGFRTVPRPEAEPLKVIIISAAAGPLALAVDQIQNFQDLFLKDLHPLLARLPAVVGASELGDGRPVLVLDADRLERLAMAS